MRGQGSVTCPKIATDRPINQLAAPSIKGDEGPYLEDCVRLLGVVFPRIRVPSSPRHCCDTFPRGHKFPPHPCRKYLKCPAFQLELNNVVHTCGVTDHDKFVSNNVCKTFSQFIERFFDNRLDDESFSTE
ncbi:hypothetical protein ANN_16933 [Periplaneta americana]|uniref:Uncharacterized protein n=1 Tax=Periplaneta americana TaxID=6978 RepID=A0ABQ8SSU1_PERAM|nr:hypothetical protein ANN_16933 [Periplaneta americana]